MSDIESEAWVEAVARAICRAENADPGAVCGAPGTSLTPLWTVARDEARAAIRALAETATPGPWQVVTYRTPFAITRYDGTTCSGEHVGRDIATVRHHPQSHAPVPIVTLGIGVTQETPVPFVFIRPEDADYLAEVSPEVVLALLDEIAALRARLAAAEKERDEALRDAIEFAQTVDAGIVRDEEYLRLHREKMEQYDRRVAAEARAEKAEAERDAACWQPIETAPRDGTLMDLWAGERIANCAWNTPSNCWAERIGAGFGGRHWAVVNDPTHWMPLPPAPGSDQPCDPADPCPTAHDLATERNTLDGLLSEAKAGLAAAQAEIARLRGALQAAVDCGMVPSASAKDGAAFRGLRQVNVADQIRAALAETAATPASAPAPADDGWIAWEGGECPVAGETMVEIRYRNGDIDGPDEAGEWDWDCRYRFADIVAYRIAEGRDG